MSGWLADPVIRRRCCPHWARRLRLSLLREKRQPLRDSPRCGLRRVKHTIQMDNPSGETQQAAPQSYTSDLLLMQAPRTTTEAVAINVFEVVLCSQAHPSTEVVAQRHPHPNVFFLLKLCVSCAQFSPKRPPTVEVESMPSTRRGCEFLKPPIDRSTDWFNGGMSLLSRPARPNSRETGSAPTAARYSPRGSAQPSSWALAT